MNVNSKKKISMLLALMFVWSICFNVVSYARFKAGDTIYSENFSSGLDDTWATYAKTWGSAGVSSGELLLKYTSDGTTRNVHATRAIPGMDCDEVSFAFDFKSVNSNANLVKSIAIYSGVADASNVLVYEVPQNSDDTQNSQNNRTVAAYSDCVYLIICNNEFYYVDGADNTAKKLSSVQYNSNTRYYFKACINNINNTYDLYLSTSAITDSTTPVLSDMPLAFSTGTAPSDIRINLQKFAKETADSEFYADNINVTCVADNLYTRLDLENELSNIKPYVTSGDYTTANSMLLTHYREKTSPVSDEALGKRNDVGANLIKDCFMYNSVSYLGEMKFSPDIFYSSVELDLSSTMKKAQKYSLELVAYDTTSDAIELSSKENDGISLAITADGAEYTDYPTKDTYIDYRNQGTNYGSDKKLYVQERMGSSTILEKNTRRVYIQFDLSEFADKNITSAKMTIKGKTSIFAKEAKATVWLLNDDSWEENTLCWNNTMQNVLCFNGAGGIPWKKLTDENLSAEYISGISSWWERMYWMTSLANNYVKSGSEQYAQAAIDMLMAYIDYEYETDVGSGGGLTTAIRARELAKSHHHLTLSDYMTPEKNLKYIRYMYDLGKYLEKDTNFRPNHNWGTFQILGLNHTASYLTELIVSAQWRELAIKRVGQLLENIIASDGSYVEGSTHYAYEALTQIMKVISGVESAGNKLSADVIENLRRCTEYALNTSFPNGYDIGYGDGGYAKINIDAAVNYLNDENLSYIYTGGKSGTKPDYTSKLYPDGRNKMAILRSGFAKSDLAMYINNGAANRLSHTHPDDLAVIAYAYQNPLLIDPGSYSYDETEASEWQRHTTEAHNTVTIDSAAQAHADGTVNNWSTTPSFDYYEGTSTAYDGFSHNRKIYFIKDKLWLVADSISQADTNTHTYEQNWHFPTWATPVIDENTKAVATVSQGNANISVVQLNNSNMAVSLKDGWYHSGGSLGQGKFASYKKSSASGAEFLTLLYPHKANDRKSITTAQLNTSSENAKAYTISDGVTNDTVIINSGDGAVTVGDISFNGEFLYIRKNAAGKTEKLSALNAKGLTIGGETVFESGTAQKNLTISVSGGVMTVDSENTALFDDINIYCVDSLDKLIYNSAEKEFGIICNKVVPGRIFEWTSAGTENGLLKAGSLKVSANPYGSGGGNVQLAAALFNEAGTLLALRLGEYNNGKYFAELNADSTAQKAVFMLFDIQTLAPLTKAVTAEAE